MSPPFFNFKHLSYEYVLSPLKSSVKNLFPNYDRNAIVKSIIWSKVCHSKMKTQVFTNMDIHLGVIVDAVPSTTTLDLKIQYHLIGQVNVKKI